MNSSYEIDMLSKEKLLKEIKASKINISSLIFKLLAIDGNDDKALNTIKDTFDNYVKTESQQYNDLIYTIVNILYNNYSVEDNSLIQHNCLNIKPFIDISYTLSDSLNVKIKENIELSYNYFNYYENIRFNKLLIDSKYKLLVPNYSSSNIITIGAVPLFIYLHRFTVKIIGTHKYFLPTYSNFQLCNDKNLTNYLSHNYSLFNSTNTHNNIEHCIHILHTLKCYMFISLDKSTNYSMPFDSNKGIQLTQDLYLIPCIIYICLNYVIVSVPHTDSFYIIAIIHYNKTNNMLSNTFDSILFDLLSISLGHYFDVNISLKNEKMIDNKNLTYHPILCKLLNISTSDTNINSYNLFHQSISLNCINLIHSSLPTSLTFYIDHIDSFNTFINILYYTLYQNLFKDQSKLVNFNENYNVDIHGYNMLLERYIDKTHKNIPFILFSYPIHMNIESQIKIFRKSYGNIYTSQFDMNELSITDIEFCLHNSIYPELLYKIKTEVFHIKMIKSENRNTNTLDIRNTLMHNKENSELSYVFQLKESKCLADIYSYFEIYNITTHYPLLVQVLYYFITFYGINQEYIIEIL